MIYSFNYLAVAMVFLWAPIVVVLFATMPARRAMVVGAVAGWVLLPTVSFDLPGIPAYGKFSAPPIGILFGTILFDPNRLLAFRPRWYDLPMLVWCLCPLATSITNGRGEYPGLSASFHHTIMWFLPYLAGRLYLTDTDSFRELAKGMIVSGICLIPFCLWEAFFKSGFFLWHVYRIGKTESGDTGARPVVFFQTGLELGMWMCTVTLMVWWLRRAGLFKSLWGLPSGSVLLPMLLITSILCKANGAVLLNLAGFLTLWFSTRLRTRLLLLGLLALAPTYYYVRINNLWTGRDAVELIRTYYSENKAISIETRLGQEDFLIKRSQQRLTFGWGLEGNEFRVSDELNDDGTPKVIKFLDSLWIITLATCGLTGLVSMTLVMMMPVLLFVLRFPPKRWDHPDLAVVSVMVLSLNLFLLDCLSNAMINIIYIIIAGGLVNIVPVRIGTRAANRAGEASAPVARLVDGRLIAQAATTMSGHHGEATAECAVGTSDSRERLAVRYQVLGRAYKEHGQLAEAKAAWQHSLDLLTELLAAHPEYPALRRGWCDCANDLAWLLAGAADPTVRDPAGAVALAVKSVEMDPECSTYWNTLGAAHYRAGDFQAAVADLDQATALGDGGTTFDHVFLAMAHARLGHMEDARRWFDLAMIGMEQAPPDHAELHRLRDEAGSLLPAHAAASH